MATITLHKNLLLTEVWFIGSSTKILWITLLLLADNNGNVESCTEALASMAHYPPNLQLRAGIIPDLETLVKLKYIRKTKTGWKILPEPFKQWTVALSTDKKSVQARERMRRYRDRQKQTKVK